VRVNRINDDIRGLPVDPDVEVLQPAPLGALLREHADLLPSIAVGGAAGSLARWGVDQVVGGTTYPWATFLINVSGCLLIGVLMAFVLDVWAHRRHLRPLLGVGFLGGFTTFSTFVLETRSLATSSHALLAIVYVVGSVAAGVLAALAGLVGGRLVVDLARVEAS
jgi:CrcB protein